MRGNAARTSVAGHDGRQEGDLQGITLSDNIYESGRKRSLFNKDHNDYVNDNVDYEHDNKTIVDEKTTVIDVDVTTENRKKRNKGSSKGSSKSRCSSRKSSSKDVSQGKGSSKKNSSKGRGDNKGSGKNLSKDDGDIKGMNTKIDSQDDKDLSKDGKKSSLNDVKNPDSPQISSQGSSFRPDWDPSESPTAVDDDTAVTPAAKVVDPRQLLVERRAGECHHFARAGWCRRGMHCWHLHRMPASSDQAFATTRSLEELISSRTASADHGQSVFELLLEDEVFKGYIMEAFSNSALTRLVPRLHAVFSNAANSPVRSEQSLG